jgi:hypothetical protein
MTSTSQYSRLYKCSVATLRETSELHSSLPYLRNPLLYSALACTFKGEAIIDFLGETEQSIA